MQTSMALFLTPPTGSPSDEEEELAVFESTAAELGVPTRPRLPELSIISPGLETQLSILDVNAVAKPGVSRLQSNNGGSAERLKVFLRIRPLTEKEKEKGEEQGCVTIQNDETLMLQAPNDSQNMRNAERGIGQSMHKFSFTKIFSPMTMQQELFESTMKKMVSDVLQGENRLLYTYGVTNSGKTYTIQGTGREAGLLPRALVFMFRKLQGRLYGSMDLKPVMYQDIRQLNPSEVRVEELRRESLLKEDECSSSRRGGTSSTCDSGVAGLSTTSHIATQLEDSDSVCLELDSLSHSGGDDLEEEVRFSVWVSFYEIYNEFLYDLLEAPPSLQPRKRATLRLSDDKQGNPYVKDLTWVQVRSAEEAWRVLGAGRRNQSFASTHLNKNSSRSHSIFSIRVVHVYPQLSPGQTTHISELTVCDLAGSERCKYQCNGERMKEATNINTSLHTLSRCISALRHNQSNRSRPPQVVPFRDSKLTRVLQGFFTGQGSSSMVVNINPCASIYDETLQALKFSAIATELVHGPSTKTRVAYILSLLREPAPVNSDNILEEEESDDDDDEGDISMLNTEELLYAINVLKREVYRQRKEKMSLEASVREEVVSETMEVISSMQKNFSETLETEKALIEEKFENKIDNLKKHLKMYYSQELEERDQEIEALTAALEEKNQADPIPQPVPQSNPEELRRSQRLALNSELNKMSIELDQCRAELHTKTQDLRRVELQLSVPGPTGTFTQAADRKLKEGQRNLRQLRLHLQRLGMNLQSGERACCRNTGGERLRQALIDADGTLAKQDQILVELQNNLLLVMADLRRKDESLAQLQSARTQMPPSGSATPGSCKKRGCGVTAPNSENFPPEKRAFFPSPFAMCTPRKCNTRIGENANPSLYSRILRSRQQSPPPSPAPTPRNQRGKC
ncbi:kinesin-like protein KIF20A [Lampris incognitus]|uniref:kinesin-like protein KIF20A n=1 Tax=Lampris incognitus TaxID=2546036 RepID=UPI0024B57D7C|nr:kinesin-like protein KIF20A [Lampris incognitus]